ncbi:MLO-like protein 4 [Tripterygium wilfordii]|uniref:MLO-like protein 4 n=1 Tax=Tripterygium wilfordii TaxID=458696 RepID=UPI0018F8454C|nr:MLO-like protein 4 [Tripterygium wilfordii]
MGEEGENREEKSLADTPTWAVATVVTVMVVFGFFFHGCLKQFGKWLDRTKRKSLLAALDKIKDELMLFGFLSLLMGHWSVFVAKICVRSSAFSTRFYPCVSKEDLRFVEHVITSTSNFMNHTVSREHVPTGRHHYCPEGQESFASYESLEQLHRFVFVLGVIHVSYSFVAIALAMIKIYSWRTWENQAQSMAMQSLEDSAQSEAGNIKMRRVSTFIVHHTSHPWSQHRVLVWLLCFSRQLWSSINRADYMALRLGFISTHQLPLTYDFHNYMLRSMDEEFRDIVGISVPLWIYAIACFFLNFHGTNVYFWLSFFPCILILLIGTKLHLVVVKLAVEILDSTPWMGNHRFNLRDDLFWFGKPVLLLRLIQLISFQNAYEMATFLWSLWEIKDSVCFMDNPASVVIRLTFGLLSQFWCSFNTFPLYVIVTQMDARLKKTVVPEHVRSSLHGWARRVKQRQNTSTQSHSTRSTLLSDSLTNSSNKRSSRKVEDTSIHNEEATVQRLEGENHTQRTEEFGVSSFPGPHNDSSSDDDDADHGYPENNNYVR